MRFLMSIAVAFAALFVFAPAAGGASRAVVDLYVKGAATMRFDAPGEEVGGGPVGETCGGVPGAERPQANLDNASEDVQFLCRQEFALKGCPAGQGPDCLLQATVIAQRPNTPQLTVAEVKASPAHWTWSGWLGAPCGGQPTTCRFTYGSCIANVCSYEAPITVIAAFNDKRPPTATFKCRTATGQHDDSDGCVAKPPRVVTSPTGTAVFRARSDEYVAKEHADIQCQVDGAAGWTECAASPAAGPGTYEIPDLPDGPHTLRVRAQDPSGNVQTAPVGEATWIQRYPPETSITGGPAHGSSVAVRKPTFTFASATEHKADHFCRMDDGPEVPCKDSFTPGVSLLDGRHTFRVRGVRSVDGLAIDEVSPPSRTFTVDLGAPEVVIRGGPEDGLVTTNTTAVFRFETYPPEPDVRFLCALDTDVRTPCDGGMAQYESLSAGRHVFAVTAVDAAGNERKPALTRSWTVFADADGDRFYAPDNDCDDANSKIRPGAPEVPGNGVDENCDGTDPPNLDEDGDGVLAPPQGRDCNDRDAAIRPGAAEVLGNGRDEDCDNVDPPNLDRDGDGALAEPVGPDCDDGSAAIRPGRKDVPENGVDENCDEVDATFPLVGVGFEARWQPFRRYTRLVSLEVLNVPAGATVRIKCSRCSERSRRIEVKRARQRLSLGRHLAERLPVGARLEVRVSKPSTTTQGRRWRFKRRAAPAAATFCVRGGKRGPC